jgi:hypothetical protein
MINENFIRDTSTLIEKIKTRGIKFLHGNVLVAKVKIDRVSKGGIHIYTEQSAKVEEYKTGFARILALEEGYSGALAVGQYIMFSHEARYYPYPSSLGEVLGVEIIPDFLYTVQDNNVILTIESEILEGNKNEKPNESSN